ncbi:uncharacterized protein LOC135400068 [Ornithodoros turicata]|uniref:uncharacterized protein LOC135400068 n=1 Tax=Ornithodoros turicata TaxID=34597 RepID=UPI0031394A3E
MKIFAASIVILSLLSTVTADCDAATDAAANCIDNIKSVSPFKDIAPGTVRGRTKNLLKCCAMEYIEDCLNQNLVGECSHVKDAALADARRTFREKLGAMSCRTERYGDECLTLTPAGYN